MNYSVNEISATARKAARGAGYVWGMADEAAMATSWLCEQDLDGASVLAGLLQRIDGEDLATMRPSRSRGIWSSPCGRLCPLHAGAALSDRAAKLNAGTIRMREVMVPMLVLPFAAAAARQIGGAVAISWRGGSAVTDGIGLHLTTALPDHAVELLAMMTDPPETLRRSTSRTAPRDEDWQILQGFAHRTYAPATEASRNLGAGGSESDND